MELWILIVIVLIGLPPLIVAAIVGVVCIWDEWKKKKEGVDFLYLIMALLLTAEFFVIVMMIWVC